MTAGGRTMHSVHAHWRAAALALGLALALAGCGGGGGGDGGGTAVSAGSSTPAPSAITTPPSTTGNALAVVLDAGPVAATNAGFRAVNVPYVSVTVCTPGASGAQLACQTIDHVLLDTGSTGLRLVASALNASLSLPSVTSTTGGLALGECAVFADGYTWGSVRRADIYLAGEVARSVPMQVIGDQPGGATAIPSSCTATGGASQNTVARLGANGILGVGHLKLDCAACVSSTAPAAYYACGSSGCSGTLVSSSQVVANPVALFAQDNQGVLLSLPAVADAGQASGGGTVYFGIGSQSNNTPGVGVVAYPVDVATGGNFITRYTPVGSSVARTLSSFIDSGSNALFFSDSGIPGCPSSTVFSNFDCPASTLNLSATNQASSGSPSGQVVFSVVNAGSLASSVVMAKIAGPGSASQFDWGLPFFFGRPLYTAIENASTPLGTGPYWAY